MHLSDCICLFSREVGYRMREWLALFFLKIEATDLVVDSVHQTCNVFSFLTTLLPITLMVLRYQYQVPTLYQQLTQHF